MAIIIAMFALPTTRSMPVSLKGLYNEPLQMDNFPDKSLIALDAIPLRQCLQQITIHVVQDYEVRKCLSYIVCLFGDIFFI